VQRNPGWARAPLALLGLRHDGGPGFRCRSIRATRCRIEHPDPAWLEDLYAQLKFANPPVVRRGAEIKLRAMIHTPGGVKELR
jgi:hypothetical protein